MEKLTRVQFTNLEKVLYPVVGVRKLDVVKYYIKVAPMMLPFLEERALVVTRYPDGVETQGFYGKDAPQGTPDWVKLHHSYSEAAGRELDYIVCDDLDTLIWLANLAALELHIPLARIDKLDHPDIILFDLDPQPPAGMAEAGRVARLIREKLKEKGLKAWVKTSGKRGLHIIAPTDRKETFDETRAYAHKLGIELAKETGIVSSEKAQKRPGTVYLDYPQNGHGRTMACPYSLRATPTATVSTPLTWDELKGLDPSKLRIDNVLDRVDVWKEFWKTKKT
ncbi:MAG: non-homologous end-joining DNA ligase [Candidatus Bathyarchaeia archaeon]|jgi:bifunctional non-homologous end joining protein LigD